MGIWCAGIPLEDPIDSGECVPELEEDEVWFDAIVGRDVGFRDGFWDALSGWDEAAYDSHHLSIERRRAFMKKFDTVASSKPKLAEMAICCSFVGRRFS